MTCDGCVRALTRAVGRALPDAAIEVSLAERLLTVDQGSPEAVERAVAAAGFTVAGRLD